MNRMLCFNAQDIVKQEYVFREITHDFVQGTALERVNDTYKVINFNSIFEEAGIPNDLRKIFISYNPIGIVYFNAKEVITDYQIIIKMTKKDNQIQITGSGKDDYANFSLRNGQFISKEAMQSFFETLEKNQLLNNYLNCLKTIINVNYRFREEDVPKYLSKKR